MNWKHASNCEELRDRFEGKEAIYVEQGALRVRVNNICPRGGLAIWADVEEVATPGLGVGRFHIPRPRDFGPLRWEIGAGYLTSFSAQTWHAGYGSWSLYFSPKTVQAVVDFASQLPSNVDPHEAYNDFWRLLEHLQALEQTQRVFPDTVDPD